MRSRLLLALAAAAWLVLPQPTLGHAALLSATPGPGDEVVGSPTEIVATFSQDLDMTRTAMEVRDAAGNVVATGPTLGQGPRELRLALPDLAPGTYEVRWTSFSAEDAELERGRYTFSVLPAPSPTAPTGSTPDPSPQLTPASPATPTPGVATPTPTSPSVDGPDDGAAALVPIGLAAIALLALAAWLLRRR